MILFEAQIQEHQSLAQHYRELAAKREALAADLIAVQEQADASLVALKDLLEKCQEASPNAITTLKTAVLGIFPGDGNDSGGNQPDSPTPPDGPDSDETDEPEKDATEPQALEPEALHPGDRFWFGTSDNTGSVIKALDSGEYLCQIDGAVGEVALLRSQLHYIDEPLVGQTSDWFEAPKVGQACELSILQNYAKDSTPLFSRLLVLLHPKTPELSLLNYSCSNVWLERYAIAQNPNTSIDTLKALSEDSNRIVRAAAKANLQSQY